MVNDIIAINFRTFLIFFIFKIINATMFTINSITTIINILGITSFTFPVILETVLTIEFEYETEFKYELIIAFSKFCI